MEKMIKCKVERRSPRWLCFFIEAEDTALLLGLPSNRPVGAWVQLHQAIDIPGFSHMETEDGKTFASICGTLHHNSTPKYLYFSRG